MQICSPFVRVLSLALELSIRTRVPNTTTTTKKSHLVLREIQKNLTENNLDSYLCTEKENKGIKVLAQLLDFFSKF